MHRILIIAVGSYGDVLPLLGIAVTLKERGYPITFFSNEHFAPIAQRFDLNFVALSSSAEYDELTNHADLWNTRKGWQLIGSRLVSDALGKAYDILLPHAIPEKTIMVSSTLAFAARLLQESHGIPNVTIHLSPAVFHSAYEPPVGPGLLLPPWLPVFIKRLIWKGLDHFLIDPIVKPKLNQFRQNLGLPAASRIFHEWIHSPDLTLCLFPEWFARPQPDWPPQARQSPFPLFDDAFGSPFPDDLQQFLDQGSPPVVFTPGSANKFGAQFFNEGAKACELSGRRGLLLTQYPEQLPASLPSNVHHCSYVPLTQILPHSAALVHHGGIGTCAQAFRAGIPQIIQPLNFDQFDNGARVTRLGVGGTISSQSFRGHEVAQFVEALLSSQNVKTQCQIVADRFTGIHPLEESCDVIESVLIKNSG